MEKPISLDARLRKCASFLRFGKMADIGTDHAYLPVFAAQKGMITSAIAADINKGPLDRAKKTIEKYNISDIVKTRLCDGLSMISPDEADDIVIAGMGGELIVKIIEKAPWVFSEDKRLILQPMTNEHILRKYLAENKFKILYEEAVIATGKVYTVICASYSDEVNFVDELYYYIGKIKGKTFEDKKYILKVISRLENKLYGFEATKNKEQSEVFRGIISRLYEKMEENK